MNPPKPKLLITGASGFLGWHLGRIAAQNWEIYGTHYSRPADIPGTALRVNLCNAGEVETLLQELQPDAVIHLAAEANLNRCQTDPATSHVMNVVVSRQIADWCGDRSIPFVFSSTDQVFDGTQPPYSESDSVSPINHYGEQKAKAEVEILTCYPKAAVCRMPLMFGNVPSTASSFLQPFIQTLRQGKELRLFQDEIRTPVSGTAAARGLLLALEQVEGLIHLGGREAISRLEFGCLMAEVLDLPVEGIKACYQRDVPMAAPRPGNVSLDSAKAFALGYAPLSLREELIALKGLV
jgi:dTDP-4-dehydrorhamnose reductase